MAKTLNAGSPGSIPGHGARSHMSQQRLKILHTTTKTWHSQINIINIFVKERKRLTL